MRLLPQARFVFGNRLIPSTLLLTTDKAECQYTTKPAACSLDYFMQALTSKAENFRVSVCPSLLHSNKHGIVCIDI